MNQYEIRKGIKIKDIGSVSTQTGEFAIDMPVHGVLLYKFSPLK